MSIPSPRDTLSAYTSDIATYRYPRMHGASESQEPASPPTKRSPLLARLFRTFIIYTIIIVVFPLTLILLMELLLALRAVLVTAVGLVCFATWGLLQHGLPPLPIVSDIVSTYLRTAALGGTRFALMFAPSSLVVGVGAAIMHATGGTRWRPSHIARHLSIADPRTSLHGGLSSVFCDIGVGSIFLPMGIYSFFGMQPGLGKGTGVAAEHPLVSFLIGMLGSAAISAYYLLRDAAAATSSKKSGPPLGGEKPFHPRSEGRSAPQLSFLEEILPWGDMDLAFNKFSSQP